MTCKLTPKNTSSILCHLWDKGLSGLLSRISSRRNAAFDSSKYILTVSAIFRALFIFIVEGGPCHMPSCEVVLKPLDGKVNFVSLPTAKRKTRFLAPLAIGTLLNLLVFCIMHFANDRTNMVRVCPFVASYSTRVVRCRNCMSGYMLAHWNRERVATL